MKTHCPICLQREGEAHKLDCQNAAYVRALEEEVAKLRKALGKSVDWVALLGGAGEFARYGERAKEESAKLREALKTLYTAGYGDTRSPAVTAEERYKLWEDAKKALEEL